MKLDNLNKSRRALVDAVDSIDADIERMVARQQDAQQQIDALQENKEIKMDLLDCINEKIHQLTR